MSFYPCRGGGKSLFGKAFKVIGACYADSISGKTTLSINSSDADFVVVTCFYKNMDVGGKHIVDGDSQCISILGNVGDHASLNGIFNINEARFMSKGEANIVLEKTNSLTIDPVQSFGGAQFVAYFCKYI